MKKWNKLLVLVAIVLPLVLCVAACQKNQFSSWNDDAQSLAKIKEYVEDVTNESSPNFIPKEDRVVVSDNDGTLYGEKAPLYYDCILYVNRVLYDSSYTPTQDQIDLANRLLTCFKNHDLDPDTDKVISKDLQIAFDGMTVDEFNNFCNKLFESQVEGFNNVTYKDFFYQPMIELLQYLKSKDFDVFIVTGVDRMATRALIKGKLDISPDHVIGTDSYLRITGNTELDARDYVYKDDDKVVRDSHQIIKNTNSSKVLHIIESIGKQPVLCMGNTSGDESMANYTVKNNKYRAQTIMVLQDDNDRDNALLNKVDKNKSKWEGNGWIVISIKNDWKTIYGDNVTKK